jgi:hypothetical protein
MITIGQQVTIKPEWQDDGDSDYIWTAISEPNQTTGYFKVRVTSKDAADDMQTVMELYTDQVEPCAS